MDLSNSWFKLKIDVYKYTSINTLKSEFSNNSKIELK